jgi:hypothetical protein
MTDYFELLTTLEAARFLKVRPQTLAAWRHYRKGPRCLRVGTKAIRYRMDDLLAFVERREADHE